MNISDFDYALPREAIAQQPLPDRDASKLLLLSRETGRIEHHVFRELPDLLRPDDLLILNRSRVFPARLLGRRAEGGESEVMLLRRCESSSPEQELWEALVRPGRRLRPGHEVEIGPELSVRIETGPLPPDGRRRVSLRTSGGRLEPILDRLGRTPLPPYIRRPDDATDRDRYQTVYARERGSVAAPTAGLHFSEALLARLRERGTRTAELVLHVGPATFQPVRVSRVEDHRLAAEPFLVPPATADAVALARARGGRVVAVGTTSTRALEWVARADGLIAAGEGETQIAIVPGFRFRVVDALLTNFHLPRSSLLLLVSAFAGRERVLSAYAEALRAGYRFYSYGDAMLVL
jgi:S-adenosylmethionine:tRNA ribosyltransferase-isomerase